MTGKGLFLGLVCLLAIFAASSALGQALVSIRAGTPGAVSDAGIFIGLEKGYFAEEGLQVQLNHRMRSTEIIPALATGLLDVGGIEIIPGFINAIQQGAGMRIVATKGSFAKGHGFNVLVVRRELFDAGTVRSVRDLRGRRVAVTNLAGVQTFLLERMLARGGVSLREVQLVPMAIPDMPVAVHNGAVDAAMMVEPSATISTRRLRSGIALLTADAVVTDFPAAVLVYSEQMRARTPVATRWMRAYLRGLQLYNDALRNPAARAEVVEVLKKYTPLREDALFQEMIWPGLRRDGVFDARHLLALQAHMVAQGALASPLPVDRLVDFRFVREAARDLKVQ
ncbi:MAG: ABC transporter substrate-binding protein [Armatimonadota bacterium]|nr:ABC transporter substrate-binding protein [Armatimonadota bacterium]MDR7443246.1 ABC transporter substrate-binding protein [Armatimonadota bacterium]MDR7571085.1 ABC transporter substrate-binding protein [Armatimonadota bacterium]MDR7614423.1 ABC transporter substrate-binding protein [Armatimonadota bacterium]